MRKLIGWIIPLLLAFFTLYFTKPSVEKCKEAAIEKLATRRIKASVNDILVKDHVIARSIKYITARDTFSLGYGMVLNVKIRDSHLEKIPAK